MSAAPSSAPPRASRFRIRSPRDFLPHFALPSWVISIVLHGVLLLLLLWVGQRPPVLGERDAGDREIGLVSRGEAVTEAPTESAEPAESMTEETAPTSADPLDQIPEATPQVEPSLPSLPVIGVGGVPLPSTGAIDPRQSTRVTGSAGPRNTGIGAIGGGGGEGTSFFNIDAEGTRFVYVIDSSGSMSNHNAINVAKAELTASLQNLDSAKQFQILFYNTALRPMPAADRNQKLFYGTDVNRTLARQFINSVQPDGGTDHLPALTAALRLNPDVIYFLTDADEPQLSAGDLEKIQKLNKNRTQIHTIEFGKGASLDVDNFLKRLAKQNDGQYRYRDVSKFSRKDIF